MFGTSKTICKFATSLPETVFLTLISVAVFFATCPAVSAENIGYRIPLDCCTSKSVIVSGRTGSDSLLYFTYFIFRPMKPETTKIQSGAKSSNAALRQTEPNTVSSATIQLQTSNPCLTILSEKS